MKSTTARADRLASQIVCSKGYCEHCGSSHALAACHVMSRLYYPTRWEISNLRCLCSPCHAHFHDQPAKWIEFIGYDEYYRLHRLAHSRQKTDIAAVLADLRERTKAAV